MLFPDAHGTVAKDKKKSVVFGTCRATKDDRTFKRRKSSWPKVAIVNFQEILKL